MNDARRVVDAKLVTMADGKKAWRVRLSCGHTTHTLGRMNAFELDRITIPPKTSVCLRCQAAKERNA